MVSYGAVNAAMLDGGSSAMMYYENYFDKYETDKSNLDQYQLQRLVNKYKAFTPPRRIPTFFCVSR
jgi:exopolysaccharide biosynthesis protein